MIKRFALWLAALSLALGVTSAGAAELDLGAGDVLKISVYNNPDLGLETRISESGTITFPLIGSVAVAGMPPAAAEKKIGALLEKGGFLKQAQVNIIVTVPQSQMASVLGQVNRPGRYPVDGKRSVLDLLALAGGVSADGADSATLIRKRNGTTTKDVVDIIDVVRSGQVGRDLDLAGNDVIYVERAPRFYIYGEVQRPGAFRLERGMTVVQALSTGGGLTPRGTERGLTIKRRGADGKLQVLDVKHDDLVQVDDVIYVKESLF